MAMAARAMEYSVPENSTATTNLAALRGTRITEGYSNEYMIKTEAGHKAKKSLLSLRERRPPAIVPGPVCPRPQGPGSARLELQAKPCLPINRRIDRRV
jgi:hypothetical protein